MHGTKLVFYLVLIIWIWNLFENWNLKIGISRLKGE